MAEGERIKDQHHLEGTTGTAQTFTFTLSQLAQSEMHLANERSTFLAALFNKTRLFPQERSCYMQQS